jgi:hypothetical protein
VLSKKVDLGQRRALWSAAAILACIAFTTVETDTPYEVGFAETGFVLDLDRLKTSDG